jgi:biotin carboxyl carrier protein
MRFRKTLIFLTLATALVIALPAWAQQKSVGPSGAGPRPNAVRPYVACAAAMPALPPRAQQKPFTQEQVSNMVRDGFGDESGAKLIEQRGIDFAPSQGLYQTLKAAGASEAFLNALRAAKPPKPASAKKPLNQVQVFAPLVGTYVGDKVRAGREIINGTWYAPASHSAYC